MKIKAVDIREVDFSAYGRFFNMIDSQEGTVTSVGDGYMDCCTIQPIIDTPANIGFTKGSGTPFRCVVMERHAHTQEAQLCEAQPIVFLVAAPTLEDYPSVENVKAILLPKGHIAVLNRGVWHSSSHGLYTESYYYWIANAFEGDPTIWREINGGPIDVIS